MSRIAYCSGCGRYVELTYQDECPEGHPRSALRDVREGTLASAPRASASANAPTAEEAAFQIQNNVAVKAVGIAIIAVPVTLVLAWGLWSGMAEFGDGMSWPAKLGLSAVSLVATVGLAFLMYRRKRH